MKEIKSRLILASLLLISFAVQANSVQRAESEDAKQTLLGNKLSNPYSVDNMREAFKTFNAKNKYSVIGKKAVIATHQYVQINPRTEAHLKALELIDGDELNGIVLHDTPLDREVLSDGDYYVNPENEEDLFHPIYTVIPVGYRIPGGVPYDVLEGIYQPTEAEEQIEDIALDEAEGISVDSCSSTKIICDEVVQKGLFGKRYTPKGRVMIRNSHTGELDPLRLARISIGRGVWWRYVYTDINGYFNAGRKYRGKVRIRAKWRSPVATIRKSWNELLGVAVSDHLMTITRGNNNRVKIIEVWDSHLWYKGTVYNGIIKYNQYAAASGIFNPVLNANIWVWKDGEDVGVTPMLYRYRNLAQLSEVAGLTQNQLWEQIVNRIAVGAINLVPNRLQPDIIFSGLKGRNDVTGNVSTLEIDQRVFHEAGHFSHASRAGAWYWANIFSSELVNHFVQGDSYADGIKPNRSAGERIGVAEGWATLVEYKAMESVHGGAIDSSNTLETNVANIVDDFNMRSVPMIQNRADEDSWFLHGLFWDVIDDEEPQGTEYLNGVSGLPIENEFNGSISDNVAVQHAKELFPIFRFLTSSVANGCSFGDRLVDAYPEQGPQLEELFHSYGFTCIDGGDGVELPATVNGFRVSTFDGGAMSVEWNLLEGATSYRMYIKANGSNDYVAVRQINAPGQSWNSHISNHTYVKMQACNSSGCGPLTSPRYAFYYSNHNGGNDNCSGPGLRRLVPYDDSCPIATNP